MSLSDRFKDLLAGGLPDVLDYGRNAPSDTDSNQFVERTPPQDAQTRSITAPQPNNMLLWVGFAGIAAVGLILVLKK